MENFGVFLHVQFGKVTVSDQKTVEIRQIRHKKRLGKALALLLITPLHCTSVQVYGMGSGLFFLGYAAFQIPSNLILRKVGGANWLSFIVLMWGICATSFSMVRTVRGFYALRLLLGITEAGAIPGMW